MELCGYNQVRVSKLLNFFERDTRTSIRPKCEAFKGFVPIRSISITDNTIEAGGSAEELGMAIWPQISAPVFLDLRHFFREKSKCPPSLGWWHTHTPFAVSQNGKFNPVTRPVKEMPWKTCFPSSGQSCDSPYFYLYFYTFQTHENFRGHPNESPWNHHFLSPSTS